MTLPLTGDETSQNNTGSGNKGKFNVVVYDDEKLFSNNAKLNIFTNTSYYVVEDKIAPTSENTYQFVIRNNNEFNIQYDFEAVETNEKNINMKYRLKRNGKYVLGNDNEYISVNELKQYNINLASKSYDVYTLEWKWFESSNDTEIGMDVTSKYSLFLKLSAIQY